MLVASSAAYSEFFCASGFCFPKIFPCPPQLITVHSHQRKAGFLCINIYLFFLMEGITKPGPVHLKNGNMHAKWLNFKQKFEIFLIAAQKTDAPSKVKWAALMGEAGEDALQIYDGFKSKLITSAITADHSDRR